MGDHALVKALDEEAETCAVFFDLQKAFDTMLIDHLFRN